MFTNKLLNNNYLLTDTAPFVINQTTMNIMDLKPIYEKIKAVYHHARFADEICSATRRRQESLLHLDEDVDGIIVLGSRKSSNTHRLMEITKSSHPTIDSYWFESAKELDGTDFSNKKHLVIASGASTPEETIDEVYSELQALR